MFQSVGASLLVDVTVMEAVILEELSGPFKGGSSLTGFKVPLESLNEATVVGPRLLFLWTAAGPCCEEDLAPESSRVLAWRATMEQIKQACCAFMPGGCPAWRARMVRQRL